MRCCQLDVHWFLSSCLAAAGLRASDAHGGHPFDVVVYGGTSAGVIAAVQATADGQERGDCVSRQASGWADQRRVGLDRHRATSRSSADWRVSSTTVSGNIMRSRQRGSGSSAKSTGIGARAPRRWMARRGPCGSSNRTWPSRCLRIWSPKPGSRSIATNGSTASTASSRATAASCRSRCSTVTRYRGAVFIDATYEGDLMAAAGVDYHVGRESRSQYDEQWNGVQTGVLHHRHHFGAVKIPIDPYRVPGDPVERTVAPHQRRIPGRLRASGRQGAGLLLSHVPDQSRGESRALSRSRTVTIPGQYELLLRILDAGWRETFQKFDPIPNRKTDTNNHGPFSTDNIGYNYDYPEASYERRREIVREHEVYQQGLMYFLANDPRVPADVREQDEPWGSGHGRVHRQRSLAAPALRSRGAAHDRALM